MERHCPVQKGCFKESLKDLAAKDEIMFVQSNGHFSNTLEMVAASDSESDRGTVKFRDEDDGLYAEVELANTTAGRDIYELVSSEVIKKVSSGVYIEEYSAKKKDPDKYEEDVTITKAILDETSFVPRPRFHEAEAKGRQRRRQRLREERQALYNGEYECRKTYKQTRRSSGSVESIGSHSR